jgi:hypothetical protein
MNNSTHNPFEFEGGDLRILVTHKGQRLVGNISTSAMMLASPVWKKFIFPPFAQLDPEDDDDGVVGTSKSEQDLVGTTKASNEVRRETRIEGEEDEELIVGYGN